MLKEINVNFDVLEMMLFYWESVASKDKMSDEYFIEIANKKEMQVLYNEEFSVDSFRRVLSAISNREKLNSKSKAESRFWSQNMRMIEDLELTRAMLAPIKTLNISSLVGENLRSEKLEVVFIPFCEGEEIINKDKIYFNFFNIIASRKYDENGFAETGEITVFLHEKTIKDYVIERVKQVYKN